jgi:hypothetical protein
MKRVTLSAGLLAASVVFAQGQTVPPAVPPTVTVPAPLAPSLIAPGQTPTTSPMPAPQAGTDTNAPLPGANSFTEAQAKSRLEDRGYSSVAGLAKDDSGVWRGTAMRDNRSVKVSVDYRGNIVAN